MGITIVNKDLNLKADNRKPKKIPGYLLAEEGKEIMDQVNDLTEAVIDLQDGTIDIENINVDTISEKTLDAGVTINGLTVSDIRGTGPYINVHKETYIRENGTVSIPALQIGEGANGFYEVSTAQLGVSIADTLTTIFEDTGVKSDSFQPRVRIGSIPETGTVSLTEYGDGLDITAKITLTDFVIATIPAAAAPLAVGAVIYTCPAGQHFELVYSFSNLSLTLPGTTIADLEIGLGSAAAEGAVFQLDGTPTFEDRINGQTIGVESGGGTAINKVQISTAVLGGNWSGINLNETTGVKFLYLNVAGNWNVDNAGDLLANGDIFIKYTRL
jgi:hypothetical protein